jgi:2-oxoglutarate dehydrogenase complex dehydrogenase (E1) component-like enzyme
VRAKQQRFRMAGVDPDEACRKVAPILMHGDAAFAGQGVLAETLNFHDLDGFSVGGTVHVIVNNRIGFTTEPHALWSGASPPTWPSGLPIPIFHVNGEDPEAVVRVARIAMEYRYRFGSTWSST